MRTAITGNALSEASCIATVLLEERIAAGDTELEAVSLLLQHYQVVISRLPPLAHIGTVPLRPSDHLYACFDQLIELLHKQYQQVADLQAIVSELL
nr:hypothetical protein [uncultured Rhodopila sp.]